MPAKRLIPHVAAHCCRSARTIRPVAPAHCAHIPSSRSVPSPLQSLCLFHLQMLLNTLISHLGGRAATCWAAPWPSLSTSTARARSATSAVTAGRVPRLFALQWACVRFCGPPRSWPCLACDVLGFSPVWIVSRAFAMRPQTVPGHPLYLIEHVCVLCCSWRAVRVAYGMVTSFGLGEHSWVWRRAFAALTS